MPTESSHSATISWPTRDRNEIVTSIQSVLPALREELPVRRIVLFGSHASGRATVASDIDLLVVYEGPSRKEAFATVKKAIPLRGLEPHVYTVAEAAAQSELLARMTQDGIVIFEAS